MVMNISLLKNKMLLGALVCFMINRDTLVLAEYPVSYPPTVMTNYKYADILAWLIWFVDVINECIISQFRKQS
jgi:hypothetical protein